MINSSFSTSSIPSTYDDATFNQIVFVNGDLTISNDLTVADGSTALFIVKGDVNIDESAENVGVGLIADGNIYTAYDLDEGKSTKTLNLNGVFVADRIVLQRTLQGADNSDTPSESFIYEPKYVVKLKDYFNNSATLWRYDQ